MTSQEKAFLHIMDEISSIAECWRTNGGIRVLKDERTFTYDVNGIVHSMENNLSYAGTLLGLRAIFRANASKNRWTLTFVPKNGHARLMMERYFQLLTERELNDECGQG